MATIGGGSDELMLASDILRYITTFVPAFPMVRSIMTIAQVRKANMIQ